MSLHDKEYLVWLLSEIKYQNHEWKDELEMAITKIKESAPDEEYFESPKRLKSLLNKLNSFFNSKSKLSTKFHN